MDRRERRWFDTLVRLSLFTMVGATICRWWGPQEERKAIKHGAPFNNSSGRFPKRPNLDGNKKPIRRMFFTALLIFFFFFLFSFPPRLPAATTQPARWCLFIYSFSSSSSLVVAPLTFEFTAWNLTTKSVRATPSKVKIRVATSRFFLVMSWKLEMSFDQISFLFLFFSSRDTGGSSSAAAKREWSFSNSSLFTFSFWFLLLVLICLDIASFYL